MENLLNYIVSVLLVVIIYIFMHLPFILLALFIWSSWRKNKKKSNQTEEELINLILLSDSNFDAIAFKNNANRCISLVYDCIGKFNVEGLLPLVSNELYKIHETDIMFAVNNGEISTLNFHSIGELSIVKYSIDGDKEIIGCKAFCGISNIRIEYSTKKVISYAKMPFQHYYFEFVRTVGIKTIPGKEFTLQECPNCGAVIEINAQGKCIYCDSLLLNGEHSWVLNKVNPYVFFGDN